MTTLAPTEEARGDAPAMSARPGLDLTGPLPGILALAGCAFFALSLPPIPDHAWQFYMAERMLDGARLYVDVGAADMHPPLFTWMAMAIAAFARLIGADGLSIYPVVVIACIAIAASAWWRLLPASGWMLAALAFALLAMAGPYFGQGEHLAIVLALPYLAAAARAADGQPLTPGAAVLVGAAAGFGLAMKPYFALVWVGVEIYVALCRGWRSLVRTESLTIGSLFVAYVLATLLLTPTFFEILPWLAELYPRYSPKSLSIVLPDKRVLLLGAGLVAALTVRSKDRWRHVARILAIAAAAMYVALLMQGKGWGYHWYPVNAIAALLCALAVRPFLGRIAIAAPALAAVAIFMLPRQIERTAKLLVRDPTYLAELMEVVEQHADGGAIVAISPLLETGFPLVSLTGARWASPYAHLWMVPALYSDERGYRLPIGYRETGKWQALEQQIFDRLWEAIEREDPAVILMHIPFASAFDFRAYFETDARFRERFARHPVVDTVGRYIVLGPPPPAAP